MKDINLLTTISCYRHNKLLAGTARSTILQQRNPSFGEILDQEHFSCRRLC